MSKVGWLLLAALLACDDGTIGNETCVGSGCQSPGFKVETLFVPFTEVRTQNPWALPAPAWSIPNACTSCPATERAQLFWAGGDRAWNVVRGSQPPVVQLITADGKSNSTTLAVPPGVGPGVSTYVVGQPDGTLLMHTQWAAPPGQPALDEISLWSDQPVQTVAFAPPGSQLRPLGAIKGEGGNTMLFDSNVVDADKPTGTVRLLGPDGSLLWQRGFLPDPVAVIGGSAVWNSNEYVLVSRNVTPLSPLYVLAWFAAGGKLQRGTVMAGALWRSTQLYDRGQGQFAAVALSELTGNGGGVGANANEGNLDIVTFSFDSPVAGWRLRRDCFFSLEPRGFAIDAAGNMFVSTNTGIWDAPRGMLCRIPAQGEPKCYQTDPFHTLGSLVTIGPSSVIAEYDDQLVRFDLN